MSISMNTNTVTNEESLPLIIVEFDDSFEDNDFDIKEEMLLEIDF